MRLIITAVVLGCASCAIAQITVAGANVHNSMAAPPSPSLNAGTEPARPSGAVGDKAAESTPVATLQGICREPAAKGACKTVITRGELDRYLHAFAAEVPEAERGRLALQYIRTVAFSTLAELHGVHKNPQVAEELELQMKVLRMRILAGAYTQNLAAQTASITAPEIQKYYDEHLNQFEQARVRRLSVPLVVPTENGLPLERPHIKAELDALRKRAVDGDDFDQLQKDAYKDLHIQATPPPVNVLTLVRNNLQGDEAKAFDLNPGEISTVLDGAAAVVLIKLESKDPMPLASVRGEIEAALRGERMQEAMDKLNRATSAQFDLGYLGTSSQPDLFSLASILPPASRAGLRRSSAARRPAAGRAAPPMR